MLTYEESLLKTRVQFSKLLEIIQVAHEARTAIHEVEEDLWAGVLALGRSLLEGFVASHGDGCVGPSAETDDGRSLVKLPELHDRRYVSVFGELTVSRAVYAVRESQELELVPLDAVLQLPDSDFSLLLQHWTQRRCVTTPFKEASKSLREILGFEIPVRTEERINRQMAVEVDEFREHLPTPADDDGALLVVAIDCKGVPMRRESGERSKSGTRRKKGEKANKKRMAAVGAVYSVDEFVRTPDDIIDETLRKESAKDRPRPQAKRVRAELTREIDGQEVNAKDRALAWAKAEVESRNPDEEKTVICLADGERALWTRIGKLLPYAIFILDIFHVLEKLWKAANTLCGEGTEEAERMVDSHLRMILEGKVGYVAGALKQMSTKRRLRGSRRETINKVVNYLVNNRAYMKYDEYLAAGYPIGSGVGEGACRHLVKDRMEGTGMRWTVDGAQAMLSTRATLLNDDWSGFYEFRGRRNAERYAPQLAILNRMGVETSLAAAG